MASGGPTLDSSEDDGDPPWQERQPVRDGSTLVVYFPVPPAIECCELGCGATYNPATWTSRRQSLERHLEAEHGARITSTSYICSLCGDVLGQRPMAHVNKCLANVPTAAPPPRFRHQCDKCPRSFPARKGLHNHQQWHLREEAKQARQNVAAGAPPRQPPTSATGSTSPHQQASPGRAATPGTPSVVAPSPSQSGAGSSPGETDQQQRATASPTQSAAAGPSPQEVLPTPLPGGVEDAAGSPADHQAARPSSPSDEYCSPAEGELPEQTAGRAIGSPPPPSPEAMTPRRVNRHSGSTYGTQEEMADTAGPESAWVLAEMTAELRALSRLPVSEEEWARTFVDLGAVFRHVGTCKAYVERAEAAKGNTFLPMIVGVVAEALLGQPA
ncbi:hypothetical protein HPB51_029072 [Rhipicephalus microplus]|uniref:C2H2-type domain-containing protein n=1 Tax=Rhipicephalus microplus TaxID=6941 RepID=A0A9J6CV61_RHIMP|nr:hypothetical protein HPB51_029072 [Rhipicephalus microplus]